MLRQRAISSRIAYTLMGGVMTAAGYAIAIRNSFQLSSPGDGTLLTMGLLPTIAGMIAGFLYTASSRRHGSGGAFSKVVV